MLIALAFDDTLLEISVVNEVNLVSNVLIAVAFVDTPVETSLNDVSSLVFK